MNKETRLIKIKSCVGECPHSQKHTDGIFAYCDYWYAKDSKLKRIKNDGTFPSFCPLDKG